MSFTLPPLPYDYAALEPYIDATTMQIHHECALCMTAPASPRQLIYDTPSATYLMSNRCMYISSGRGRGTHDCFWSAEDVEGAIASMC